MMIRLAGESEKQDCVAKLTAQAQTAYPGYKVRLMLASPRQALQLGILSKLV